MGFVLLALGAILLVIIITRFPQMRVQIPNIRGRWIVAAAGVIIATIVAFSIDLKSTDWLFWIALILLLGTVIATVFKRGGWITALFAGAFLMVLFGVFVGKTVLGDRAAEGQELLAERALDFLEEEEHVVGGTSGGTTPSVNGFTATMLRSYTARIAVDGEYILPLDRGYICYTFKEGASGVESVEVEDGVKFVNTSDKEVRVSGNRHPLLGHKKCGDAFIALQQAGVL